MTAHRLNRNEYTNTIRDLLGVRFRAEKYFPADDSGDGFDNIGDVLTVSPLLMERYLAAAERIASWAISTDIPAKPIEVDYRARDRKIRRLDRSTIEAEHRVDFGGEYVVRIGLPGERPPVNGRDAAPVTLGFWMDGALLTTRRSRRSRRASSTSIRTPMKISGWCCRRATTSSAPGSSATTS